MARTPWWSCGALPGLAALCLKLWTHTPRFGRHHLFKGPETNYGARGLAFRSNRTMGPRAHDPLNLNQHGKMNAGLVIPCVASERRDAPNERDGAGAAQLRRSSNSVAAAAPSQQQLRRSSSSVAAALQPSTQMVVSSSRPSSRCCQQHLEEGRDEGDHLSARL